jgi:SAM-dependent methyltransferase
MISFLCNATTEKEFKWWNSPRKALLISRYMRGRVLNVGCGNMYLKNAINLDIDLGRHPDILADFHYLPFRSKVFDTIFAFDVIEHSSRPKSFILELERVCKNEGNVIIETGDFNIIPKDWAADEGHKTYINRKIFRELIGEKYSFFNLGRDMLLAIKKTQRLDKLLYQLIPILITIYRTITMQPKDRATHWR